MPRIVYRSGSDTLLNLTPRADRDLVEEPGSRPGISTQERLEALNLNRGDKVQLIDLDLLKLPLVGIADNPLLEGGKPGHVAIAPVDLSGNVDLGLLQQWAESRGGDQPHPLTLILKDAITEVKKVS